jgi:hypothetical protein
MPYIRYLKSGISGSFSSGSGPTPDLAMNYPHKKEQISVCSPVANLARRRVAFEVWGMKESVTLMTMSPCFVLVRWMTDKTMAKEVEVRGQSYS